MDFSLTEDQEALRDLAAQILAEQSTKERLDALDASGEWLDRELWQQLVDAGIVGVALPEEHGGGGYGFVELHLVLQEVGATVAHVPLLETVVMGGLPIAEFGSDSQRQTLLPGIAAGDLLVTTALVEDGRSDTTTPATTARRTDDGWRLDGTKSRVPIGQLADRILVPARTDDGDVGVFVVDPSLGGVTVTPQDTISGRPHAEVVLDGVVLTDDDVLGEVNGGEARVRWIRERAQSALASTQAGVTRTALGMAAAYTSEREQFGRKIGSFQAVGQRVADAWIDTEGIRLTALQAAWRLGNGEDATQAVTIAKWWAAEGAHKVVHAVQHVHGGVGIDFDYPLHRYFTAAKEIEFSLGHATAQLLELGRHLAAEPV